MRLSETQLRLLEQRRPVCLACEHYLSTGRFTVRCARARSCSRSIYLPAAHATCPADRWPPPPEEVSGFQSGLVQFQDGK